MLNEKQYDVLKYYIKKKVVVRYYLITTSFSVQMFSKHISIKNLLIVIDLYFSFFFSVLSTMLFLIIELVK